MVSSQTSRTRSQQNTLFLDTKHGRAALLQALLSAQIASVDAGLDCWQDSSVCCAFTISSGSRTAVSSIVGHGRHGHTQGRDREPHRAGGNQHRHRAHCKDGCRAARSNFDGQVANVDQKPSKPGASSARRAGGHEGLEKAWKAAADLMQELLAFELTSDTASLELFDKECLRLK